MQSVEERRRELYTSLEGIGQVQFLTRYGMTLHILCDDLYHMGLMWWPCNCVDGCELEDHTELDIGEGVTVPCPCNEFLINGDQAWRQCGGSYTSGGQLHTTNFSQCKTVADDITSVLCSAVVVRMSHVYHNTLIVAPFSPECPRHTRPECSICTKYHTQSQTVVWCRYHSSICPHWAVDWWSYI